MICTWVRLRYWFLDVDGRFTDCNFYISETEASANWSNALQFADALADILMDLSECNLHSYDFQVAYRDFPQTQFGVSYDLQSHGTFILESTTADRFIVAVPAINPAILMASGDWAGIEIDTSNTDVAAFATLLINGDGTVAPVDMRGMDLVQLNEAYLQYRAVMYPDYERA